MQLYLKKAQVFSCEYCAMLKKTYFEEHLCTAACNYGNLAMFFEKISYTEYKKSTTLSRVSLLF